MFRGDQFNTLRGLFFAAIQRGDQPTVEQLLERFPIFIYFGIPTKGSSPLHVAAEAGHAPICQLLLDLGHETNPVDKEGKTPYQLSKTETIKSILAKKHLAVLSDKYYSVKTLDDPRIDSCDVLPRSDFDEFVSRLGNPEKAGHAFGVTYHAISGSTTFSLLMKSYFREDILMVPYYGELLVIHENEQVIQTLELLKNIEFKTGDHFAHIKMSNMNLWEARAHLKFVSSGLALFPFLRDYPQAGDSPEKVEAKKLFIGIAMVSLIAFYQDCNPTQQFALSRLPTYRETMSHVASIISKANTAKNLEIAREISDKYSKPIESKSFIRNGF